MSSCGCGNSCNCGSNCTCNKFSGLSYTEGNTAETVIMGVGPAKVQFEDVEMGVGAENGGCNCGSSCSCDPCTCK